MGLDQYGMIRNGHIDWKKVYSDKYEPTKDGFVWRKVIIIFFINSFVKTF